MLLGDLGADVIKVERPDRGDDTRDWGPPFDARGESAYYLSTNRNKFSLAADLGAPSDRDTVIALLREADVVVENFLPGALARAGIDHAAEQRRHPQLIWCTITGFGADSPRPGYDFVVQAESGWMAITGEADGAPMKTGVALADVMAGKDAAIAILAALAARAAARGSPRHLVISLADSARAALINVAQNALVSGVDARRYGNAHANLVPYQLFEARDRPLVVAAGTDAQWRAAAGVLGLDVLAADPQLRSNSGRLAQRERIVREFSRALATRDAADWLARFDAAGVPAGVVKTVLEAIGEAGTASPRSGMPSPIGGMTRFSPPTLDQQGPLIRRSGWGAFSGYREAAESS